METESLLEKKGTCDNNPQGFYETKINKHRACDYSLFTHCSCDNNKTSKISPEVKTL